MSNVVIRVENGIVSEVIIDDPSIAVIIWDLDTLQLGPAQVSFSSTLAISLEHLGIMVHGGELHDNETPA